jgi:hypothetical protein
MATKISPAQKSFGERMRIITLSGHARESGHPVTTMSFLERSPH